MDVPNHRSSHKTITPRGGGLSIVLAFLIAIGGLASFGYVPQIVGIGSLSCLTAVALLGFIDDCGVALSALARLSIHFAAAGLFLLSIGGCVPSVVFGVLVDLGWLGHILAAMFLVWMLNLFNFMDGIDGIASVETITVSLSGALLWSMTTSSTDWIFPVLLAAAVAGFLIWNHPPAKIFMGDAGSCFLGASLGGLAITAGSDHPQLFWSWVILLGCFIVDATVTLIRRLQRGKRFDEAHRSHAYQYAARKWNSHKRVTYAYGLVNVVWLLPIAALVALGHLDGVLGLLLAYAPLIWLAFKLKAGAPELQEGNREHTVPVAGTIPVHTYSRAAEVDGV